MPQSPIPAPSVLAGMRQALKPHAPFAAMNEGDLDRIVRASQLKYFAPGEIILAPAAERPAHCYVIRQGTVRGERPGAGGTAVALWELSAGEMFPLGALIGRRGVTSIYRATQDTFCLKFPVAVFDAMIGAVAGLPGLLHAPARAPARPVADSTAVGVRGHRHGAARALDPAARAVAAGAGGARSRCAARRRAGHDGGKPDRLGADRRRRVEAARHLHAAGRDRPGRAAAAAAHGADARRDERTRHHAARRRHRRRRRAGDGAARRAPHRRGRHRRQGRRCRLRARSLQPAAAVGARARIDHPARSPTYRRWSSAPPTFAPCRTRWSRRVSPPGT